MGKFLPQNIAGIKYGRLTAIKPVGKSKSGNALWECMCECGNVVTVNISNLKNGHTKSCGCLRDEIITGNTYRETHNESRTRLYHIWQGMKQRCNDKNSPGYKWYGGRGISLHEPWANDYETFRKWAMANGYSEGVTIDRINPNGNYEPSNCRWATVKEQNRNKTTTSYITLNGETKSMGEWGELLGIPMSTMVNRKNKGLPPELILYQGKFNKRKPDYERMAKELKNGGQ